MSASKHKRERKETQGNGNPEKSTKDLLAKKQDKKQKRFIGAVVAVFLVLCIVAGLFSSSIFVRNTTAVTIGDHDLSPSMFSYFYKNAPLAVCPPSLPDNPVK